MRVTSIDMYTSDEAEAITFSLKDIDSAAQYRIRNIVGLDAEEIVPKFYGFGLYTQPKFYEFGLKARDIVIRVALNPRIGLDESFSDVRDELYKSISSNRSGQVVLHFNSGGTTVAKILGFITRFEVPYFTKLPEVQITVRCDDPMFRALNPVLLDDAELPTSNPVILADSISTAPHGVVMQFVFTANAASFTIQDRATNPEWTFKITPAGGFLTNDVLYISSEYLNRMCYMIRSSTVTYLLDKIEPTSVWPILFPGANSFHFQNLSSVNWLTVEHYPAYWGV